MLVARLHFFARVPSVMIVKAFFGFLIFTESSSKI